MTAARRLVLSCLLAFPAGGCAFFPMTTRHARSGRVVDAASGAPVADAQVVVSTQTLGFGVCGDPERSYETRTDADGRWHVPARHNLRFLMGMPDAGYEYEDRYLARAPDGATVLSDDPCRYRPPSLPPTEPPRLRLEVGRDEPAWPRSSPTMGLLVQGEQRLSLYAGYVWFVTQTPVLAGISLDVRPGLTGGSAGASFVAMPGAFRGVPFPALGLGVRALKPWLRESPEPARFGPELSLFFLSLRFSVTAYSPRAGAALDDRDYVLGVGFGYL